jgi:hypothetical protein
VLTRRTSLGYKKRESKIYHKIREISGEVDQFFIERKDVTETLRRLEAALEEFALFRLELGESLNDLNR